MIANAMSVTHDSGTTKGIRFKSKVRLVMPGAVVWYKGKWFQPVEGHVAFVVRVVKDLLYLGKYPRVNSICACVVRDGVDKV